MRWVLVAAGLTAAALSGCRSPYATYPQYAQPVSYAQPQAVCQPVCQPCVPRQPVCCY